jgi:hypothetical protein
MLFHVSIVEIYGFHISIVECHVTSGFDSLIYVISHFGSRILWYFMFSLVEFYVISRFDCLIVPYSEKANVKCISIFINVRRWKDISG